MSRLWKTLRRWLAFAFLFGVILFGTVAMLLNTETGSRFAINRVAGAVPGSLYVDGVEGTLWRSVNIRVLGYRNEKIDLTADNLILAISWPAALAGSIVLTELGADEVNVRNLARSDASSQPLTVAMPPLPVSISVRELELGVFKFTGDTSDLQVDSISADDVQIDGSQIRASRAAAISTNTHLVLTDLDTTLDGDVPVTAGFNWQRTDPEWSGQGSIGGSLASLNLSHELLSPVAVSTEGTVAMLARIEPFYDLQFRWQQYVIGETSVRDGEIHVVGVPNAYETSFSMTVTEPRIPEIQLTGSGNGNTTGLMDGEYLLQSQTGTIRAIGEVSWLPPVVASLDLDIDDFDPAYLNDGMTGKLSGKMHLEMSGPESWSVTDIELGGDLNNATVAGGGNLVMTQDGLHCSNCAVNLETDDYGGVNLTVSADGTPDRLVIDLTASVAESMTIDANSTIGSSVAGISGIVHRAVVNEQTTGRWVLQSPLTFRRGDDGINVEAHRWLLPHGRVEIERVSIQQDQLAIVANLDDAPLATANPFLPAGYRLDGIATAEIDVARDGEIWTGTVNWTQSGTTLHVDQPGEEEFVMRIPEAEATAEFADGGASVESQVLIDPGVSVNATVVLADLSRDPHIDGRLRIAGDEWDWVTAVVPELDNFSGDISANLTAIGPASSPDISGEVSWLSGATDIPGLNVPLRQVNVTMTGAPNGAATIAGAATAGDGKIEVHGTIEDLLSTERSIELEITGDTAELMNWPEYRLWATPDIALVGTAGGWDASGKLEIPKAEISVRELPENAVTVSADVRTIDEDMRTSMSAARYSGEATIVLGEDVHVTAFGLDTMLKGELMVRKSPDQALSAVGRVDLVDGEFVAYGQRLKIEEGTLTFTGPLDDPIVNVRVTRTIEDFERKVVAGIRLTGRANDIRSTVYAEPAMSEADALSYLMIGRPLAEATSSEGGDLSNAAVGLGLRQAARITQQIGQSLGLDELTIIGEGGDATALVAGKQFNSRLYARYAYGVFSRLGMILIRYRLTERLSLEAGAGETQSIDIVYSVEKQ
jgi:autotransporter translocation and assembly factor TamB